MRQRRPLQIACVAMIPVMLVACGSRQDRIPDTESSVMAGPYMGQKTPGMTPEKFLGDVLDHNFCSIFSPDGEEFYFTHYDPETNACSIECMMMIDGVWSAPKLTSFSSDFIDNDIAMSPDGGRVMFRSKRPLPGQPQDEERDGLYLWTSVRTDAGWSEPEAVAFGGRRDIPGGYPALTSDGAVYFTTKELGDPGPKDIHRSRFEGGAYGAPENLGGGANSPYGEGDLFVSPDESFLIVSCYDHPDNVGGESLDLWVSFRTADGSWTEAANLGPPINTEYGENCPAVSPDGKFLFFNRYAGEEGHPENGTYWVDARYIERFRPVVEAK